MNQQNRGYKIPDNPVPAGLRCMQVYIPDDDMYLYAFMGAYGYMAKWIAWEKDGTMRGSQAASAWAVAYQETRAKMGDGCIDMDELITAIDNCCASIGGRLSQIANAITSSTNNTTITCGNCLPTGTIIEPEPETYDPDNDDVPPEFDEEIDPVQSFYDSKCQWANGLADSFITLFSRMSDAGLALAITVGATAIVTVISLIVPGVLVITAAGILVIISALLTLGGLTFFTFDIFQGISSYLQANRQAFVCSFYESNDTDTTTTAVKAVLFDAIEDAISGYTSIQQTGMREELQLLVTALVNNWTINLMFSRFDEGYFDLDYSGADCTSCSGTPVEFDATFEELFGNNDIEPFNSANGIGLHTDIFYNGDGHVTMIPTPATSVATVANNDDIGNHAGINPIQPYRLAQFEIDVSHSEAHGSTPSNNSLTIVFNEGQVDEITELVLAADIETDTYTRLTFTPGTVLSGANGTPAVTLRCNFGGTFNAETKIGRVWFGFNLI